MWVWAAFVHSLFFCWPEPAHSCGQLNVCAIRAHLYFHIYTALCGSSDQKKEANMTKSSGRKTIKPPTYRRHRESLKMEGMDWGESM